jgi:hypothetical protein
VKDGRRHSPTHLRGRPHYETEIEERFAALREELGPVPGPNGAEDCNPALAGTLQRKLERTAVAAQ